MIEQLYSTAITV